MHKFIYAVMSLFCTLGMGIELGYEITSPGQVEYELERSGAPKEGLKIQALVVGHKANGTLETLLKAEPIDIIPSSSSSTRLTVSSSNFAEWKKKFQKITAGLQVLPRPGSKIQWQYENLLTAEESGEQNGMFHVRGRWVAK